MVVMCWPWGPVVWVMVAQMALTRSLMERRPMPGVADVGDWAAAPEGDGEVNGEAVGEAAVWTMVSMVWGAAGLWARVMLMWVSCGVCLMRLVMSSCAMR